MTSGAYSDTGKYKVTGSFSAHSVRIWSEQTETYKWYSYELSGWIKASDTNAGLDPSAEGASTTVKNNGKVYSTSAMDTTEIDVVHSASFVSIDLTCVGNGSATITNSSGQQVSSYGGRYYIANQSLRVSPSQASGNLLSSVSINGQIVSSPYSFTSSADSKIVVRFVYSQYNVIIDTGYSGGTITADKKVNGQWIRQQGTQFSADIGSEIRFICVPSAGYTFSYLSVKGSRYVTSTTIVSVNGDPTSNSVPVTVSFSTVSNVLNVLSTSGSGTVTVTCNGTTVPVDGDGKFSCTIGSQYTITAIPTSGNHLVGLLDGNDRVTSPHTFIQGGLSHSYSAVFAANESISVVVYCGETSSATEQTWHGCSCTMYQSGSTFAFVVRPASGYPFSRLYIEDLDNTGKGSVTEGPSSTQITITKTIDFNARVVAIFKDSSTPTEPADEDQGGNPSSTTANVSVWEGGSTRLKSTWRSKRAVFQKPVSLSCARVYSDCYGTTGPLLRIMQFSSPFESDTNARSVSIVLPSQNAVRLPVRRPEKYLEVEIESLDSILEVSVGTSMESLCRQNI